MYDRMWAARGRSAVDRFLRLSSTALPSVALAAAPDLERVEMTVNKGGHMTTVAAEPLAKEFHGFPKIARLFRDVIITEKIDGTNAAVGVTEDGQVYAQSRKRIITVDADNHGFARWVADHEDELCIGLGPGLHFGEWWGLGINRGYELDEKRFSLFNVGRWKDEPIVTSGCCYVVPTLAIRTFDCRFVRHALAKLEAAGSAAAPGFMQPEGIVVYHKAANTLFKATIEGDERGKEFGA